MTNSSAHSATARKRAHPQIDLEPDHTRDYQTDGSGKTVPKSSKILPKPRAVEQPPDHKQNRLANADRMDQAGVK
ncbi:MAG: hypothetical protein ACJAXQ_000398 [Parvibaculaceae bacterium]|jgi:hypothetical protein